MATKKLSGLIQIGGSVASSLGGSIKKTTKDLGKIGDEIKNIARQQDKIKKYDSARSGMRTAIKDYEQARIRVEKLGLAFRHSERPTAEMRREMDRAVQSMHKLGSAVEKQKTKLHSLRRELHDTGVDTRNLAKENDRLGHSLDRLNRRHSRIKAADQRKSETSAKLGEARGNLVDATAIATAVLFPTVGAIKADAELEHAVGSVAKVMEFSNPKEKISALEGIRKNIQDVREVTGQTADELGDLFSAAASDNQTIKQQREFGLQAAKTGVAWDMAAGDAGRTMMAWRSGMKLTMKQTFELGDAVNYLDNRLTNVRASDLAETLQRGGGGIKATGVLNELDAAAISASFLSAGSAPDVAATAQKHFIRPFIKSFATKKGGRQAWAMLGNIGMGSPENIAKEFTKSQTSARKVMFKTIEAIHKLPQDKQGAVILRLFGDEAIDPIQKLAGNVELLAEAFDLVDQRAEYAGKSVNEEFKEVFDQKVNKWARLRGKFSNVQSDTGKNLQPATDGFFNASNWLLDRAKNHPKVAAGTAVGATAVAGGLVGKALLGFGKAKAADMAAGAGQAAAKGSLFGRLGMGMAGLGRGALQGAGRFGGIALQGLVRFAPMAIGLLTRLIGLIPGWGWALAGVATVTGLLIANWKTIGPVVKDAWDSAVNATMGAWKSIEPVVNSIGSSLSGLLGIKPKTAPVDLAPVKAQVSSSGKVIPMPSNRGGNTYTDNSKFNIVIHPAGNLNEVAIAKEIEKAMERNRQQQKRRALHDQR